MSRPNKRRGVFAEAHLAQRIAAERDARGWTNDGLAKRMTEAGCPMVGSAIFKIEKADPPRRIVVDELVTFAKVFEVPLEHLLLPPEVAASQELTRLVLVWNTTTEAYATAQKAQTEAWEALHTYAELHPGPAEQVLETLAAGMTEHGVRNALTHTAGAPDTAAAAARATDRRVATYQEAMRDARDARDKLRAELTAVGQPRLNA